MWPRRKSSLKDHIVLLANPPCCVFALLEHLAGDVHQQRTPWLTLIAHYLRTLDSRIPQTVYKQ